MAVSPRSVLTACHQEGQLHSYSLFDRGLAGPCIRYVRRVSTLRLQMQSANLRGVRNPGSPGQIRKREQQHAVKCVQKDASYSSCESTTSLRPCEKRTTDFPFFRGMSVCFLFHAFLKHCCTSKRCTATRTATPANVSTNTRHTTDRTEAISSTGRTWANTSEQGVSSPPFGTSEDLHSNSRHNSSKDTSCLRLPYIHLCTATAAEHCHPFSDMPTE